MPRNSAESSTQKMVEPPNIAVVIPALNEALSIPSVLKALNGHGMRELVTRIIVADNGSTDDTAKIAREHGAEVVNEPERGYGAACLKAIEHLRRNPPDIVVFLDADFSDDPSDLPELIQPILEDRADFVVGSRVLGEREAGSLTPQQRVGNAFACLVLDKVYRAKFTDLGPFRAIRWSTLEQMQMKDRNWGWTVEMQVKAARKGVRFAEVPVRYRRRIGVSKVSGTLMGTVNASRKILYVLARHSLAR